MRQPQRSPSTSQASKAVVTRLRNIRRDAGLTGRALAGLCDWHESKISRIENLVVAPSADDVRAWCRQCEVPGETDDLIEFLVPAVDLLVAWPRMEHLGLAGVHQSVQSLWERTGKFRSYSSWIMPGVLQTPDYTRTALRSLATRRSLPGDTSDAEAARADRQSLLHEGNRQFSIVIEETVLWTDIGSPKVMAAQLINMLKLMLLPSVSLAIIPRRARRAGMWPAEDFWIFDQTQVNVELISGWLTHTEPREIAMYEKAFSNFSELAVRGPQARALITKAINALPD